MNGFSAEDMSTAAANGHRDGYQAGYADAVKAVEVGKPAAAPGISITPRPMGTAPRDGTMVRLLVQFDEHATEDTEGPAWTIGACNDDNVGDDEHIGWQLAGWCWDHDHFTEGKGTPVGWLPLIDASPKGGIDACTWAGDGEGNWHTACGEIFTLMEGSPADNKMHHCPYCGKNLMTTGTDVCVAVIGDSYEDTRSEAHDAARYRWLRNHYEPSFHDSECDSLIGLHGEDLDDAIDDEMQATSAEVGHG